MVVIRVGLVGVGHKHKHPIAKLQVDQDGGEEYLFTFIGKLINFVIGKYQNFRPIAIHEDEHLLILIFLLRNGSDLSDDRKPDEGLIFTGILNLFKLFIAVDGFESEDPVVFNLLPEQHQFTLRVELFQDHFPCVDLFCDQILHLDDRILHGRAIVVIYFCLILLNARLLDIEFVASLKNVQLGLRKYLTLLVLIVYLCLRQFAYLFKAFLFQVQQHQCSCFNYGAQDLMS